MRVCALLGAYLHGGAHRIGTILIAWYAPNLSDGGRLGAYICKTAFHFLKWLSVACGLPFTMESTHRQLVAEVTLIGRW